MNAGVKMWVCVIHLCRLSAMLTTVGPVVCELHVFLAKSTLVLYMKISMKGAAFAFNHQSGSTGRVLGAKTKGEVGGSLGHHCFHGWKVDHVHWLCWRTCS